MTYRWLTDLDAALSRAGIPFTEVPASSADPTGASSWRERGRPASTGQWNPAGVLCHHTASPAGTSDQAELNVILRGNAEAPGPISQLFIGRSATVYLVAAGRANHGGKGRRPGIDTGGCADMNAALLGIEAANAGDGREAWPDAQTDIYGRVVAALCSHYGWPFHEVYLHATTGPPNGGCNSKIDPAGPWQGEPANRSTWTLDVWRQFCAAESVVPPPTPVPPEQEEEPLRVIVHVDESQPAGSPGYFAFNALWLWSGTTRYHLPSEIGVKSAVYESTGDPAVFSAALGDIRGNSAWVQPVGSLDGYGAVVGADPGDV